VKINTVNVNSNIQRRKTAKNRH